MRQPKDNSRSILKGILAGRINKDQAQHQLQKKHFNLYACVSEFMGGTDNSVVKRLFANG